jgi:hypothetical protein
VHNPDRDVALSVSINISMTDAGGSVVKATDDTVEVLLPGEDAAVANGVDAPGATKITAQVSVNRWQMAPDPIGKLSVENASRHDQRYSGTEMSGNVVSTWTKPVSTKVVAVLRDQAGTLQGGTFAYVRDIPSSGQKSFTISTMNTIPAIWSPTYMVNLTSLPQ